MTPNFALTLNHDGIALLQRSGERWLRVGRANLEDADLPARLAELRAAADVLAGGLPVSTLLVLPESQVLYTQVPASGLDSEADAHRVGHALEGATPYQLDELAFDWVEEDGVLRIAAVARETLEEAEDFAAQHRFNPVSFVADPPDGRFPGLPFFGATAQAVQWIPLGESPLREVAPVRPSGDATLELDVAPEIDVESGSKPATIVEPEPAPEPAAFATNDPQPAADVVSTDNAAASAAPDAEAPPLDIATPDTPTESPAAVQAAPPQDPDTPQAPSNAPQATLGSAVAQVAPLPTATPPQSDAPRGASTGDEQELPEPDVAFVRTNFSAKDTGRPSTPGVSPAPPAGVAAVPAPEPVPEPEAGPSPTADPRPSADVETASDTSDPVDDTAAMPTFSSIRTRRAEPPMTAPRREAAPESTQAAGPAAPETIAPSTTQGPGKTKRGARRKGKAKGKVAAQRATPPPVTAPPSGSATAPGRPLKEAHDDAQPGTSSLETLYPAPPAPRSEAEAMTVFGARKEPAPRNTPRYLGLALTLGLLVLIGLAALWSLVLNNGADTTDTGSTPPVAAEPTSTAQITPAEPALLGEEPVLGENGTVKSAEMIGVTTDTASQAGEDSGATSGADGATDGTADAEQAPVGRLSEMNVEPAPLDPVAARAAYATTGIWQRAPEVGYLPAEDTLQDLEIASIDPSVLNNDAYALPDLSTGLDRRPRLPNTPRHPDTTEQLDENGRVVPTESGALSPGGVLIHSGRPFLVPPVRPLDAEISPVPTPAENPLADFRPRTRPGNLIETTEKALLGGRTKAELARLRPRLRPASIQETGQQLDAAARMADAETVQGQEANAADVGPTPEEAALAADLASATRRAVPGSPIPRLRPANISQIAARARQQTEQEQRRLQEATARAAAEGARDQAAAANKAARDKATIQMAAQQAAREQASADKAAAKQAAAQQAAQKKAQEQAAKEAAAKKKAAAAEAAAAAKAASAAAKGPAVSRSQRAKPTGPTPASVAARATEKNAVALNRVALIGVYGGSTQRRALVRLASGKYVKVKVGDRLDGGKVAAIGKSDLHYKKGSRTVTLKMPKG